MADAYYLDDYIEEDYYEEDRTLAITPLPAAPSRGMAKSVFIETANTFLAAIPQFATEMDAVATAMSNTSTSSVSTSSHAIGTGSKTFAVEPLKGYLPGQSVKAAVTANGTIWMQGDVTAYNPTTGALTIAMNASQGSGTYTAWTLTLATSVANSPGSLLTDFSVKSLRHAIGAAIASASTIDLSSAGGNMVHVTGSTEIQGATMTAGKDVLVVFDGTPQLTYHSLNLRLNSGGANVTAAAGDWALFAYDGSVVRVTLFRANGKAIVETAPPGGIPVGTIIAFARSSPPAGYLVCPTAPANISRVTYSDLYTAIGITWGAGDGATTFGMPWFPADYAMLQASGNVGSPTTGSIKAHTHDFNIYPTTGGGSVPSAGTAAGGAAANSTTSVGGAANLAAGHRVLICVKYLWG